jgi:hypothetical protein
VLRALVPIGFMPIAGPGFSVQIVICDAYAPMPRASEARGSAPQMDMGMSMDMPMDLDLRADPQARDAAHSGHGAPGHAHGTCPYGASPALGALPQPGAVTAAAPRPAEPAASTAQIAYSTVPARAQSPRGPPA